MKYTLLIIFQFLLIQAFGQLSITGFIKDVETGAAISYASVGLRKQNIGVNSGIDGKFVIISIDPEDSLIISSAGYISSILAVSALKKSNEIFLKKNLIRLQEVKIGKLQNSLVLNNAARHTSNSYTSNGSAKQVAQFFELDFVNVKLKRVTVYKWAGKAHFRLRIYDVDTLRQIPSTDLCDTIIEVMGAGQKINVDLTDFNIIVPNKRFYVAVQWLFTVENQQKVTVRSNGVKIRTVNYSPSLCLIKNPNDGEKNYSICNLFNDGKWKSFYTLKQQSLAISVTVEY